MGLGMKGAEFDMVFKNAQGGDFLRRPHLDRKQLMKNIKRAKESREWFALNNAFRCKIFANDGDANITEIRRTVTEVCSPVEGSLEQSSTEEKNYIFFPHPIVAIDGEVSASYGSQYDFDDVSDSSKLTGISLSDDKVEEIVEQTVDMKNGAPVMNTSEKNQDNIGQIEPSEPTYNDERVTGASDRTSVIYTPEKEAQTCSANDHNLGPNSINTTSSEFESNEQFAEICSENLDCDQGIKPSLPFISDKQMVYAKDSAHQFSTNVVSETTDGSSDCFKISTSALTNNKTLLDISVSDLNGIQEIEAPSTSRNVAQTAHCEAFSHNMSIIGTEACKTPVMADTVNATSPQRSREEPVDLMRDNMQSMQEPESFICSGSEKQLSDVNENKHNDRTVHSETQTRLEADNTGVLDNASTPSL
uniref:Uncharacterized protein n=1 Tax=Arundo donax TaxID=35708 RepID=A0A0A9G6S2_ARUDO